MLPDGIRGGSTVNEVEVDSFEVEVCLSCATDCESPYLSPWRVLEVDLGDVYFSASRCELCDGLPGDRVAGWIIEFERD